LVLWHSCRAFGLRLLREGALKESPVQAMYLVQAYKEADPLYALCLLMLWMAGLTFVVGTITQEFSWVDRIWYVYLKIFS
jgi:steroid 5-alpha reductase family enzyme